LLTLDILLQAIPNNYILKDSSAFNIQFLDSKPIFIDSLSFDEYIEGSPWVGYKQFCQHFLNPLLLMAKVDYRLGHNSKFIDGIPINLTRKLLPFRSRFNINILMHVFFHDFSDNKFSSINKNEVIIKKKFLKKDLLNLILNLRDFVNSLQLKNQKTEWQNYYNEINYHSDEFKLKKNIIKSFVINFQPKKVLDIGSNIGLFSRLASSNKVDTVSADIDHNSVNASYLRIKKKNEKNLYPIVLDISNPSSDIGWDNSERENILDRADADSVFALAVIHHLRITNNIPIQMIANFFHKATRKFLVIEFVGKNDSQVQKMLRNREDYFDDYNLHTFEKVFFQKFKLIEKISTIANKRYIYIFKKL